MTRGFMLVREKQARVSVREQALPRCKPKSGSEIIIAGSGKGSVCSDDGVVD